MMRFSQSILLGAAALALIACGAPSAPPLPPLALEPGAQGEHLSRLVEGYWTESARLTPWYSWGGADLPFGETAVENIAPQSLADSLAIENRYLAELQAIPRSALDAGGKLTFDIFRRERALTIEGLTYPQELLPVNPFDGMPMQFALMAPAAQRLALSGAKDYDAWRLRSESFVRWMNQAIANMRDGMRRGYTLPRVLVQKTLPQLEMLGTDSDDSVFYQPLHAASAAAAAQRQPLAAAMTGEIKNRILPSYRALHEFLQREYLPRSRLSVSLSALPLGDAWYAYRVKRAVGGLTPAQVHALGMAEVERLHQRVQALLAEAGFPGNAQGFVEHMRGDPRFVHETAADLLSAYQGLKVQVGAALPPFFASLPRAEFAIRDLESYRKALEPAVSYRPRAPNGMVAAVLYVDTAQLESRPAGGVTEQFLREAMPGHHYQLELQRERADLPRFRRFGGAPAFIEGWALYAGTLGEELGLYHDPEAKFAALLAQLSCASDLVIDTGLHAQGWSRQQALEYLHAQLPIDEAAAEAAVDRDIALPADALACTVGFLKIQKLRAIAQQTLGARFDLRAFHNEVIKDGAMPLDILDAKLNSWTAGIAAAPPSE